MNRRAFAWMLALLVGGAGCAAESGAAKHDGGGTGQGGSTTTGSGGAGGGMAQCQVNIQPVSPASFDGLTAGPAARLRVRGDLTGLPAAAFTWRWQVTF